ncbi:MAG: efflux RND transporter permease subunit, partial [Bacteroidota bacterium]
VRQDIAIKIFGENIGILANKAEEAKHILQTIEGVGDIQVEPTAGLQQIVIEYDRQKLGAYGLDIETINQHVKGSFAGLIAGQLLEGEKRFDIVVRLGAAYRNNLQQIKKLYIPLPSGGQVPLTTVAKVAFEEGPSQISRDNTQRRIVIGVNARNRDVQSLVTDIQTRLQAALDLPPGYYVTYGGQFENLQRARKRLWLATPVALLLIFLLLYFTFRSLKQTFMIFTAIPLAAIGGIWALVIRGMPFSISAGIGFIALFGVAVLNGIVLIAYYNQLKQEGWHELVERIKQGALVRLRPILMTATVASLGFLPMAVSTAAGAEVQQPLATVVIGGLITSTLLSLVILPILYYLSESRGKVNTLSIKKVSIWLLFGTCAFPAFAQDNLIDLEEAVSIARNNALSLQRDSLYVAQQEALSMGSLLAPKVNIFATGEEIGSGNESVGSGGIQSLGFLQTFYLPSYRKSSIQVQQQKVAIAGSQLQMTHKALERAIREAYIQSLYAAEVYQLYKEAEQMYQEFLRVAQAKFDQGETGRTPLLNAETRLSQGKIQTMQAEMAWEIALQQFNNLLFADQFYRPIVDSLPYPQAMFESYLGKHPQIEMAASQLRLATSNIRMSKSRMLPQIQTGGQIQSIGGDVPFWGYQLGLIFPLSKKSYKTAIQSASLREKALQAELENQQRLLSQRHGILKMELVRLAKGFGQMDMYVVPLAEKQWRIAEAAYFQGELSYLSYMQTLDQLVVYAISRLDTLRMWNLTWAEWLYWFEN